MKSLSKLVVCLAALIAVHSAHAVPYQVAVSGTFNIVPGMAGNNELAGLLGTQFHMSVIANDNPAAASYTEAGTEGDSRGWCFCQGPYVGALATAGFSFANGRPVVVNVINNFYYEGDDELTAGTYDGIEWGGWLHDSGGGSLNSDAYYPGVNYNFHISLFGDKDLLASSSALPSAGIDLSHVLYGTTDVTKYFDGVVVGKIALDPPLHLVNGVLVGDGMSATVNPVPEPASVWLLLTGAGLLAARRPAGKRRTRQ